MYNIHEGSSSDSTLHLCTSSESKHWKDSQLEETKPNSVQMSNDLRENKDARPMKQSEIRRYYAQKPRYGHTGRHETDGERGITLEKARHPPKSKKRVKTMDDLSVNIGGGQERQYASRPLYKYDRKANIRKIGQKVKVHLPWQDEATQYENTSDEEKLQDVTVAESVSNSFMNKQTPYTLGEIFGNEEEQITQYDEQDMIDQEPDVCQIQRYTKPVKEHNGKMKGKGTASDLRDQRTEISSGKLHRGWGLGTPT